jgi:hypothetical protein
VTIPSDPKDIEKLEALAARNIANGDWGDEVSIPGIPGGDMPMTPEKRESQRVVSQILSGNKSLRRPKKK